jgi:hypothetical protein
LENKTDLWSGALIALGYHPGHMPAASTVLVEALGWSRQRRTDMTQGQGDVATVRSHRARRVLSNHYLA